MRTLSSFLAALRCDLFLAVRSVRLWIVVAVPAIAAAARVLLGELFSATEQARDMLSGRSDPSSPATGHAQGPFVDGLTTGLAIASLLLVALAAYSIASERDTGAVRQLLVRRVGRGALVVSRFAFLHLVGVVMVGGALVASLVAASLLHDFAPVVEDGVELIGGDETRAEIVRGLLLAIAPLPAGIGFGLLVSVCSRSATEAVSVAVGALLAFDLFKGLMGDLSLVVWAYYHPSLADESYLREVSRLVRGYSDVFVEESIMRLNAIVPAPEALIFVVAALVVARARRM